MKRLLLMIAVCCLPLFVWAADNIDFPYLSGQVVDEAHILSPETEQKILATMSPQQQFVVVTLNSLRGREIEEYGVALGRHWGIGNADKDDGILLIVAPNERQTRIEVGYGLEHIMTDALASQIVHNTLLPAFRQNQYEQGILNAVYQIQGVLGGKNLTHMTQNNLRQGKYSLGDIIAFIILGIPFLFFKRRIVGGYRGGRGGGGGFRGGGGSFGGGGASGRW